MHFPIYLVANAMFVRLGYSTPSAAIFGIFAAWTASIAGGALFYRWVESPAASRRITAALGWLFGKAIEFARKLPVVAARFARQS